MKKFDRVLSFLWDKTQTSIMTQIEYNLISSFKERIEWKKLSPIEKQVVRKSNMESVKRYRETDGITDFSIENAIIELYDILLTTKETILVETNNKGIALLRLELLADIIMDTIDNSPIVKNKKLPPSQIFEDLKRDLQNEAIKIDTLDKIIGLIKTLESNEIY